MQPLYNTSWIASFARKNNPYFFFTFPFFMQVLQGLLQHRNKYIAYLINAVTIQYFMDCFVRKKKITPVFLAFSLLHASASRIASAPK